MRDITEEDLKDLADTISNATPGPWYIDGDRIYTHTAVGGKAVMDERKNIHYAAVFDPEVTEGLLDLIQKRGERVEALVSGIVVLSKALKDKDEELTAIKAELATAQKQKDQA